MDVVAGTVGKGRLITDHHGSVRAVVRLSDGEVAQRIDYDAWGLRRWTPTPAGRAWAMRVG